MAQNRSMGRRRRQGNSTHQKTNNSIEDFVGNEGNEYMVPNPNRMIINMTNEPNNIHKNFSKRNS
jgi:hypothetical protein